MAGADCAERFTDQREPTFHVVRSSAEETYTLRQAVLRPHQRVDEVGFPGDDDPRSTHLRAVDATGATIGVVSLLFEPTPWGGTAAWRLRGMAVRDDARRLGAGSTLLDYLVDGLGAVGGGTIWCAARLSAEGFYRRHSFVRIGEEWEEPFIGRHVAMWRGVPSRAATRR